MDEEAIDKKIVRNNTSSGAVNLFIFGLATASLSSEVSDCIFEEDYFSTQKRYHQMMVEPEGNLNSTKRITDYTNEFYGNFETESKDLEILEDDLKFTELTQKFAQNQIDVDPEIQDALNQFAEIYGEDEPTKERF